MKRALMMAAAIALAIGWQTPTATTAAGPFEDLSRIGIHSGRGVIASAGAGHYFAANAFDVEFAYAAVQFGNRRAFGFLRHSTDVGNGTADFSGVVTCMAVDSVNRRAWIGGVITANRSTSPDFTTEVHQVGHDIWFRVLDNGDGDPEPDRSTFVGFESPAIPSSAAYCEMKIWPDVPVVNARTWPVTSGNLVVHP